MVSIPTSQIKNLIYFDIHKSAKDNLKNLKFTVSKDYIVRKAENDGYFTNLSAVYLNKKFNSPRNQALSTEKENVAVLRLIEVVNLRSCTVQRLSCLEYCHRLVYLNLASNFVSDIAVLRHCISLECLDLSTNMLEALPGLSFWAALTHLSTMYLHDNPLSAPVSIVGLKAAPQLQLLTLWDSPLSLRPRYRHFLLNTICTLKCLDCHVVSDEEVIEDAEFGHHSRFRTFGPQLRLETHFSINESESKIVKSKIRQLIVTINRIAGHTSPVLVIQKNIRGFLARRRLRKKTTFKSIGQSEAASTTVPSIQPSASADNTVEVDAENNKRFLRINMEHLNDQSTMETLDREAQLMDSLTGSNRQLFTYRSVAKSDCDKTSPDHIHRALAKSHSVMSVESLHNHPTAGEFPRFRLRGVCPPRARHPASELLVERNRAHYQIREQDRIFHEHKEAAAPDPYTAAATVTGGPMTRQRSELHRRRMQAGLALALLRELDGGVRRQWAQQLEERHRQRRETVAAVQAGACQGRHRVQAARVQRAGEVKAAHSEHRHYVETALRRENDDTLKQQSEVQDRREQRLQKRATISDEITFSLRFRSRQAAASSAIDKFEKLAFIQDQSQINKAAVADTRERLQEEMASVRAHLDSQTQLRRTGRKLDHATVEMQLLQQASQDISVARQRVDRLKTVRRLVSCPHLPSVAIDSSILTAGARPTS